MLSQPMQNYPYADLGLFPALCLHMIPTQLHPLGVGEPWHFTRLFFFFFLSADQNHPGYYHIIQSILKTLENGFY